MAYTVASPATGREVVPGLRLGSFEEAVSNHQKITPQLDETLPGAQLCSPTTAHERMFFFGGVGCNEWRLGGWLGWDAFNRDLET